MTNTTRATTDLIELVAKAIWSIPNYGEARIQSDVIAQAVVTALEPAIRERERAAKMEVLEQLANEVDPESMIYEWYEETKDYYPDIALHYWLRTKAEEIDATEDATDE
jgi:hypothetical protein